MSKTILVLGATGQQGSNVIDALLDAGNYTVKGLTRNVDSEKSQALISRGVEMVQADLADESSLTDVFKDVDGIFLMTSLYSEGQTPQTEEEEGIRAVTAIHQQNPDVHLIYSSVGGAERNSNVPHFDSKWHVEEKIRELGLKATILRPVWFYTNWPWMYLAGFQAGHVDFPMPLDKKLQQIDPRDIGIFVRIAFDNADNTWIGKEIELAGDDLTIREVADLYQRKLGNEITVSEVGLDVLPSEDFQLMFRFFIDHGYEANIDELRQIHPGLKTLEQFLEL